MKITLSTPTYVHFSTLNVGDVFQSNTYGTATFIKTRDIFEYNGLVGTNRNAFCLDDSFLYTFVNTSEVVIKNAELIVK